MNAQQGSTAMIDRSEWERQAHDLAENSLRRHREAYWHTDEHVTVEECSECPPPGDPFDDCETCCARIVLAAAWPVLAELAVAEYLTLLPGETPSWRVTS
jgi:hypothetical protein